MGQIVPKVKDELSQDITSQMSEECPMADESLSERERILTARLQQARVEAGYRSQTSFAEALSRHLGLQINRDRYAKYENRSVISDELVAAAGELLGVNPLYLIEIDAVKEKLPLPRENMPKDFGDVTFAPFVGEIQAGLFRDAIERSEDDGEAVPVPKYAPHSNKPLKALRIVGDSMDQWYPHGSYVIVCPTIYLGEGWMPAAGQHVVVHRMNEWHEYEATVKEVSFDGQDMLLWPRSNNPDFKKPWRLTAEKYRTANDDDEPIRITGLVVWSGRQGPGL